MRWLDTTDGVRLATRRWPAVQRPDTQPTGTAVVIVHGFTASKDHCDVVHLAESLAGRGFDAISYDARGHGASDGLCTLGALEHNDVAAATALARADADRVVLVGASMGGIAVLHYASQANDVEGVVTVSAPAHWRLPRNARGALAVGLTQTAPGRWLVRRRMYVKLARRWTMPDPPVELMRRVQAPVAVVHGLQDRFIAPEAALDLYANAGPVRRLILVDEMGHAYDPAGTDAVCAAVEWVVTAPAPTVVSGPALALSEL